jgi:hypothetical protein
MPKVGKKEFPYTKAGMKAAAAEKKKMMAKKMAVKKKMK